MIHPVPKQKAIRLKGKAYTLFRKAVHDRARGMCEECGMWAPRLIDGRFDLYRCGHVRHIKSKGSGGSDTLENVEWWCWNCHRAEHDGKLVTGRPVYIGGE